MHSVTDPVSQAIERTKIILFRPFEAGLWFKLGFCAFLAYLGESGCGSSASYQGGPGRKGAGGQPAVSPVGEAVDWIQANLTWLVPAIVLALSLIIGLLALLTWLSSRGKFMFLHGLVQGRPTVSQSWRSYEELGNSLFSFSFLLASAGLFLTLVVSGLGIWIAWPDIRSEHFGDASWTAILVSAGIYLPLMLILWLVNLLLKDFVVPMMYLSNQRVLAAWSLAWDELLSDYLGTVTLFYLMRLVLAIAAGVVASTVTCLTCCVAAIPYLGTVLLLPLYVFERCYVLCFIQQYGPQYRFFQPEVAVPGCQRCGYDLRYNVSGVCPECGTPIPEGQLGGTGQ